MSDPVLFTTSYEQDRERFQLLRRSLRQVGCDWPHVVAVHTEDDLVGFAGPGVTVMPMSAFLDRSVERRRAASHRRRVDPRRHVPGGPMAGWYAQQLVKLAACGVLGVKVLVHMDSDVVALRPLDRAMFVSDDGRTRMFVEEENHIADNLAWNHTAAALLRVVPSRRQFIHWPTVWDGDTVASMLASVSEPWQTTFARANAFEFAAYGVWASAHPEHTVPTAPLPVANFCFWEQVFELSAQVQRARANDAVFAAVQSRLHIPAEAYADILLGPS